MSFYKYITDILCEHKLNKSLHVKKIQMQRRIMFVFDLTGEPPPNMLRVTHLLLSHHALCRNSPSLDLCCKLSLYMHACLLQARVGESHMFLKTMIHYPDSSPHLFCVMATHSLNTPLCVALPFCSCFKLNEC